MVSALSKGFHLMSINFLGLNSNFDSGALVQQLIQIEVQARIRPLQTKKSNLESEKKYIGEVNTAVVDLRSKMDIDDLHDGTETLFPRAVTSTDTDNEYFEVTTEGTAVPQQFNITVAQLATSTVRKSSSDVSAGITGATILDNIAVKNNTAISSGTVTINGETRTLTVNTATDDVNDIISFLDGFTGVNASLNANGHIDLTGLTSLGGAGDTSTLLSSLGFDNARITATNASSLQNIDALKSGSLLSSIGINGTNLTINGESITFNPAVDTINTLVTRINSNIDTKITASYDALNGRIVFTNDDTGAVSLTVSSTDSNIITKLNLSAGETLGNNAEFTISTINGGTTLVSNSNTVEGIIEGVTIELKQATVGTETVTITQDKDAYRERVEDILGDISSLISKLEGNKDSFSRGFAQSIKNIMASYFSSATDTYRSGVELGIESTLDSENNFSSYTIDQETFDDALDSDEASVHAVLFGKSGTVISALSDASSGILVQIKELLDTYSDPDVTANGLIGSKEESIDTQISTAEDDIERRQESIDAYEKRLKAQYAALDSISTQLQSQQAALSAFST